MNDAQKKLNIAAMAILETLDETDSGECPESYAHLACEHAGARWDELAAILIAGGAIVRVPGPCIQITDRGRQVAAMCRKWRAEHARP